MSASQTTTNYNLPVFEPTDIPAWLTDWNSAMGDIDTAIAGAKTAADTAQLTASGAANGVSTLNTTVGNLQTTVGNQGSTITSLGNSLNTVQSLIGNGTPTTTDQTIIGAINEINAAYKDAANIEFDNTGTGMVATNVQAAIVEAYGHGGGGGSTAAAVSYDNTDSGLTATNVQDAIDELASNPASNVRWDSNTDRFQVLKNGSWVNSIRAFVNSLAVYVSGSFGIDMNNTTISGSPNYTTEPYTIANNAITFTASGNSKQSILSSNESIDFANYATVKVKGTLGSLSELTLDVSGYSGVGYLVIHTWRNASGSATNTSVLIARTPSTLTADIIDNLEAGTPDQPGSATMRITEITIE